jgi:hypothetical protein
MVTYSNTAVPGVESPERCYSSGPEAAGREGPGHHDPFADLGYRPIIQASVLIDCSLGTAGIDGPTSKPSPELPLAK